MPAVHVGPAPVWRRSSPGSRWAAVVEDANAKYISRSRGSSKFSPATKYKRHWGTNRPSSPRRMVASGRNKLDAFLDGSNKSPADCDNSAGIPPTTLPLTTDVDQARSDAMRHEGSLKSKYRVGIASRRLWLALAILALKMEPENAARSHRVGDPGDKWTRRSKSAWKAMTRRTTQRVQVLCQLVAKSNTRNLQAAVKIRRLQALQRLA